MEEVEEEEEKWVDPENKLPPFTPLSHSLQTIQTGGEGLGG